MKKEEILKINEFKILKELDTPAKIQDFLNKIPINFETKGETLASPLLTLRRRQAQCMEGALVAALALKLRGRKPLLMDLKTSADDVDHVVALFRQSGFWGAIGKTNHAVLRYREPVYKNLRELAMSYFHEYFDGKGRKSLRAYSDPFDLDKWKGNWITNDQYLWSLETALDRSPHHQIINKKQIRNLRKADKIEIQAGKLIEWKK